MKLLSLDLETELITRGRPPVPLVVSIHTDEEHYLVHPEDMDWSVLDDPEVVLLGANVAFDSSVLIEHVPAALARVLRLYAEGRVVDVQLAARLTDIADKGFTGRYALEHLAKTYLGLRLDKDAWRLDYALLRNIPLAYWPEGAADYALVDSWVTRKCFDAVCQVRPDALGILAHLTGADFALYQAATNGVHTHPERSRALVARVNQELEQVAVTLTQGGLLREDGSKDTKRAQALMVAALGDACPRTEAGAVQLSAEATAASGDSLLQAYSTFVSADKLRATAAALLHGFDTPLQTRFTSCVETYRTSSSMPSAPVVGMQMQNPPRASGLRECFVPGPGELFIGADYSQAELFSLAQVCKTLFGYSVMGDVLNSGQDIHYWIASKILGCTYEEAKAHPQAKRYRTLGKVVNFGLPGGLGAKRLVEYARQAPYNITITLQEAYELVHMWRTSFPCCGQYLNWIGTKTYPWELVHPITGFRRGGVGYTDGANTSFQSLTAYYSKTACLRVVLSSYDPRSPLYGWKLWNMIHDELLMRGPKEGAPAAAKELARIMVEACAEVVPDYPIAADPWCANVWSKHIPDGMDVDKPWIFADAVESWRHKARTAETDKAAKPWLDKLESVGMFL